MAATIPVVKTDVEASGVNILATKKGQLYVKLNRANKLTNKDRVSRNDPFIEMWLEKPYKQRSKDTKGQDPVFDETFCFYVRPGQNKLYVRAVDKDTFSNDKIGQTTISLDQVMASGESPAQDYKLPKWFGISDNGSVNIQLKFVEDKSA
ncbi:C2 domain-containing protein [Lobosporangium transversale]|uniref:C2 domain-containing protein n=1 Tax=Lobosporangium transversale TaxID=64571 RepID=A0A1Y2GKU0_9FUNG|nr:C2 domain-containing protein [Lobosporangium transversale]ORZ12029.1 C2 domain-containing protein [Lobosporangium transversale]|eukprot:XP_021879894.1 C2 domain-containing protein [Lobosporangium transversale]